MATSTTSKGKCIRCGKEKSAVRCEGCLQLFCFNHLNEHRQELIGQLDEIEVNRDMFRENLTEQTTNPNKHSLIKQIDQWERESIEKIQQTAKECRRVILEHTKESIEDIETNLRKLTDQVREARQDNEFNEIDISQWKEYLVQLKQQLDKPSNLSVQQNSEPFINKISVVVISSHSIHQNLKWKQSASTVAGGNGEGIQLNQLSEPHGIYIDDDHRFIYIADCGNHRVVRWTFSAKTGQVVAGGNGKGGQLDQLNDPRDVLVDRNTNTIIVSDYGNQRVVRWPCENSKQGQIVISKISCWGLTMDSNGNLYVSDANKNEVRQWKIGEKNGTLVAGGNGKGTQLDQLKCPTYMFVDANNSLYISDSDNHRVMKWTKGAKEGIVVAGGEGEGNELSQMNDSEGVFVDHLCNVYVADSRNYRVMRWSKSAREGVIIVGGNGLGEKSNQFRNTRGLSIDRQGNLYVVDKNNHRIQKFDHISH